MQRHCGLRDRRAAADEHYRERVVVLLRGDSQQPNITTDTAAAASAFSAASAAGLEPSQSVERRPFANLSGVLRTLRLALPGASVRIATTTGNASICEQARWLFGATLLVSPHGAHLTNALWMVRGATLVEVMPWGLWDYAGYTGLFHAAGIKHARINSARPPPNEPQWRRPYNASASPRLPELEHHQGRCARTEECRLFYRAHSALHFGEEELCRALRMHVPAAREPPSLCAVDGRQAPR